MLRRKKLLRLGKGKKQPSKELLAYIKFSEEVKKRIKSKEFIVRKKEEWRKYCEEEAKKLVPLPEPEPTWLQGSTGRNEDIFMPKIDKGLDTEEINAKRRAAGIDSTIEAGAQLAAEQARAKSKRIGIAYNKGNYMYIGSEQDVRDLGRKDSELLK